VWEDEKLLERHVAMELEMQVQFQAEAAYPDLNLNRRRSPQRDEKEEGLANEAQDDVSGYLDEGQKALACMLAWGS
jgi:hypothetical protein